MTQTPTTLADAPALLLAQGDADKAAERGTILFYHGLTAQKESNLNEYRVLTDAGFLVVALDNAGHGARRLSDFAARFHPTNPNSGTEFLNLVKETALETPKVVDALLERGLAREDRLGVAGWSMGGYITYRALLAEKRFKAAVTIVGSPEWRLPWLESPHLHPEAFYPTALLSQVGERDDVVPPKGARRFYETLKPYYADRPERLEFVEYPNMGHHPDAAAAAEIQRRTVAWFETYL